MAKTPISIRLSKILTEESLPVLSYDPHSGYTFNVENPETGEWTTAAQGATLDEAIGNYIKSTKPRRRTRKSVDESTDV